MSNRFVMPTADVGSGIKPPDGAKLFFTATGTDNDINTFSDDARTTPNANPVIADSSGVFPDIFMIPGTVYRVRLKNKNDVQTGFGVADPYSPPQPDAGDVTYTPTGGTISTTLQVQTDATMRDFATVAIMVADTRLVLGDSISVDDYATGNNSGILFFKVVAASTGTADGGQFIDLPNTTPPLQVQQNFPSVLSAKMFGATFDGVTLEDTEMLATIAVAKTLSNTTGRNVAVMLDAGTINMGTTTINLDQLGMRLFGHGQFNSFILYTGTSRAVLITKEFCQVDNIGFVTSAPLANTAIELNEGPTAILKNIFIDEYQDGIVLSGALGSFNTTLDSIYIARVSRFAYNLTSNSNDVCLINCIGICDDSAGTRTIKMESSHGISIQGGAFEDAEFAFEIEACEVTISCYTESNGSGVITASNNATMINILSLYSFNNGTGSLITASAGTIIVQQLNESVSTTHPARVFALTGGAKALYGFLLINTVVDVGTFDNASAGYIRPLYPVPLEEVISQQISGDTASDEYVAKLERPWKIHSVEVHVHSGSPSGALIEIGNVTDPDSVASFTLNNNAFQALAFPTNLFQTTGTYVNQTGPLFLKSDGGGGASSFQVVFRYYNAQNGNSPLTNINFVDTFITDQIGARTPLSVQFTD